MGGVYAGFGTGVFTECNSTDQEHFSHSYSNRYGLIIRGGNMKELCKMMDGEVKVDTENLFQPTG